MFFAGMARPTVPIQNQPPHNRARGIVIYNGSTWATHEKLHPKGGKGKKKGLVEPTSLEESSNKMGIYATLLTISEWESEGNLEG